MQKPTSAPEDRTPSGSSRPILPAVSPQLEETNKASFKAVLASAKLKREEAAEQRCYRYEERNTQDCAEQSLRLETAIEDLVGPDKIMTKNKLFKLYISRRVLRTSVEKLSNWLDEAVEELEGLELATCFNTIRKALRQNNQEIIRKDQGIEELLGCEDVMEHTREAIEMQSEVFKLEELLTHYMVLFYRENPESTVKPKDIIVHGIQDEAQVGAAKTETPTVAKFLEEFEKTFGKLPQTPKLDEFVEYLSDQDATSEDASQTGPSQTESAIIINTDDNNNCRPTSMNKSTKRQTLPAGNEARRLPNGATGYTKPTRPIAPKTRQEPCAMCSGSHELFRCAEFEKLEVWRRINFAKRNLLCLNCLRTGHLVTSCFSAYACKTCNQGHHSLLHDTDAIKDKLIAKHKYASSVKTPSKKVSGYDRRQAEHTGPQGTTATADRSCDIQQGNSSRTASTVDQTVNSKQDKQTWPSDDVWLTTRYSTTRQSMPTTTQESSPNNAVQLSSDNTPRMEAELVTVLGTIVVPINKTLVSDEKVYSRAVLDSASPISIISKEFCRRNGIVIEKMSFASLDVGNLTVLEYDAEYRGMTGLTTFFIPLPNGRKIPIVAYLFWQGIPNMPSHELDDNEIEDIHAYALADGHFQRPRAVHILLGADVVRKLLIHDHPKILRRNITLTHTHFGYVVTGTVKAKKHDLNNVFGQPRAVIEQCLYPSSS